MRLSIRRRVQISLVALTGLLLAAFAGATYLTVRSSLIRGIDVDLRARAIALAALVERDGEQWEVELDAGDQPSPDLVRNLTAWSISIHPGTRTLLVSPTPRAIERMVAPESAASSPREPGGVRPVELAGRFENLDAGRQRAFIGIFAVRDERGDEPASGASGAALVRIAVAADTGPISATLRLLLGVLGTIGIVTLLVAASAGTALSGTIVEPLARITADAESSDALNAVREVRGSGTGDEIDRLAATLNRVFKRLGEAFERQARFTADASHELRTPVAAIRAHAEVALRRPRTEAEYRETLVAVRREAVRIGEQLEALLVLARFESGAMEARLEEVQLDALAQVAIAEIDDPDVPAVRIGVLTDGPIHVRADPQLLLIVLRNLLSNARRHCGRPGAIEVRVHRSGEDAVLEVHDDGDGIPAEALDHIFERFYRADSSRARATGAAGLGLAIVAAIVQHHGGAVSAASPPGAGTTITLRLPRNGPRPSGQTG